MMQDQVRTLSGLNVLAGGWLIISPFLLNYSIDGNVWQQVIFGVAVAAFGLVRLAAPSQAWASWVNAAIGIWMVIAPWAIAGTSLAAKWNQVIAGLVIAGLALASAASTEAERSEQVRSPR